MIGSLTSSITTSSDTQKAAKDMLELGADLLLFPGGDGTARNIYDAADDSMVVLEIPAGGKTHLAVFACNPARAGELAALYLQDKAKNIMEVEVKVAH